MWFGTVKNRMEKDGETKWNTFSKSCRVKCKQTDLQNYFYKIYDRKINLTRFKAFRKHESKNGRLFDFKILERDPFPIANRFNSKPEQKEGNKQSM